MIGNDPSIMFINHLESVIMVLLHLHARITFSVSHLREPIGEIVNRFLKHSDKGTSLMVIRAFAFTSEPLERRNRVNLMNPEIDFTNDEGGVAVARHNIEAQSFYVSDDEKSIVVQDLLDEVKDKKLSVDFFLSLMNDLTKIMTDDDDIDPELPTAKEGENLEQKLLDLELHLDETMHRMRSNLMVIRLLGLLSEDDKFQENVMEESSRLIDFLSATLRRGAVLCQRQKEVSEEGVEVAVGGVMAVQSLNMALSILCVHLTQSNVSVDDWRQAQAVVDDLSLLTGHSDQRVAKLHKLVLTHGVILDQTKAMKENTEKIREETGKMQEEKTKELKAIKKEMEDEKMDANKENLTKKSRKQIK